MPAEVGRVALKSAGQWYIPGLRRTTAPKRALSIFPRRPMPSRGRLYFFPIFKRRGGRRKNRQRAEAGTSAQPPLPLAFPPNRA